RCPRARGRAAIRAPGPRLARSPARAPPPGPRPALARPRAARRPGSAACRSAAARACSWLAEPDLNHAGEPGGGAHRVVERGAGRTQEAQDVVALRRPPDDVARPSRHLEEE